LTIPKNKTPFYIWQQVAVSAVHSYIYNVAFHHWSHWSA